MSEAGRLIVVSNRLPLGPNPSGGLVVALKDAFHEAGGIWVGTSGRIEARPKQRFDSHPGLAFERFSFDLTQKEHENYYLGYSNSVLWPLFHGRADLMETRPEFLEDYRGVNARLAQMLASELHRDDVIWVQDYHLLPLAQALRDAGVSNRIGFFLHIPFPALYDIMALPNSEEFIGWLGGYDLVGLQTRRDVARLLEVFRSRPDAELLPDGSAKLGEQRIEARSFPVAIDTAAFAREAASAAASRPGVALEPGEQLIMGVDRLDYSKGLPNRFKAFARLLETHAEVNGLVTLLQIAPPTREAVAAYQDIRTELEQLSGQINGAYADLTWTPIRYIHRAVPRARLAGLYRQAAVGLVTPLADGMNLVAKEYVAAQDPDNPGVLILSDFAGAAEQMEDALLVNPFDLDQVAEAMARALKMPKGERCARYDALMDGLLREDINWWSRSYLKALRGVSRGLS
ncbi:trehalose-6-phosphate synthase [Rhodophyticola sp. CCM32]|uniref:alpha,alpha-trehalose-phosphate synthase (UDP-forming) n=1 Tax=Rhodophyticola sp. CCM32 TaxID=2916397 RepID=UPI00107FBD17|nr:trehalose-6-phosphate synthase [Rhodophyticola sp. CCM32]QBY00358.1 trehalose-6-phosphate synthase [Rhodophyticola sp. CCM32]